LKLYAISLRLRNLPFIFPIINRDNFLLKTETNDKVFYEGGSLMEKEKRPNQQLEYDQEGEMTVHQQITEAYQSGVVDKVDQGQQRTNLDDEESLQ
jgi:hypothetical protein